MLPPGEGHVFGTDNLGRDVWSRVAVGSNVSLLVGFSVALITSIAGTAIGCAAAYFRGLDDALMRVMDALMAFPAILLALAITAALEPGLFNIVLALSVAYVPRTARIARSGALVIRELEYVQAARASGAGAFWIVLRHFVPNVLPALTVQTTFVFSYSVLAEATLSFLGVGPPPPTPTWGTIISEGRDYLIDAWWISLFPGIAITMTVLGLNLIGDGMRDALDPRLRVET
jgi:peptide/nickel transport system permease protein